METGKEIQNIGWETRGLAREGDRRIRGKKGLGLAQGE